MVFLKLLFLAIILLLLLLAAPFIYTFSQVLLLRWKYRHIPSPKVKSFLLGHAKDLIEIEKQGKHYSMLIVDWTKIHGSVFVLFFVNRATVICLEPNIVKELLLSASVVKPKDFIFVTKALFGERFLGNGLFSQLNHPTWKAQRKILNPAFKRRYLMDLMPQYNDSCKELITFLTARADGQTEVLMSREFSKVTLDIIAKVAFGIMDLNVIVDDNNPFSLAAGDVLRGAMVQYKLPLFGQIDPRSESRKTRDVMRKATRLIREYGRQAITKRFEDIRDGKDYPHDILTHMLQGYVLGREICKKDMAQMQDEFTTFFIAGHETTSHMLSFTFEFVGRHPKIYRKVQEEVDRVIGDKELITYEDTTKLEYMNLVLKESLRLAPPVVGIQRNNTEDLIVNGVKIPAGSNIELNNYALSRDQRFWDEPETFKPERFKAETNRNPYAYFPFAMGPRVCIGQHFAMIEAKVIMSKIFQAFNFSLVPGVELRYINDMTLKPLDKTPLYLTLRKGDN